MGRFDRFGEWRRYAGPVGFTAAIITIATFGFAVVRPLRDSWAKLGPAAQLGTMTVLFGILALGHFRVRRRLAVATQILTEHQQRDRTPEPGDLARFKEMVGFLPSSHRAVLHLQHHPHDASFDGQVMIPLEEFARRYSRPEEQFHNEEVSAAVCRCVQAFDAYLRAVAMKTAPRIHDGRQAVADDIEKAMITGNQFVIENVRELDALSDLAFAAHQEMLSVGHRLLRP